MQFDRVLRELLLPVQSLRPQHDEVGTPRAAHPAVEARFAGWHVPVANCNINGKQQHAAGRDMVVYARCSSMQPVWAGACRLQGAKQLVDSQVPACRKHAHHTYTYL